MTDDCFNGWKVEHPCPQCGAPVVLEETDRILQCEYCRNRLYISPVGHFKYFLTPKETTPDLFFLPYWRFKGMVFSFAAAELEGRIVDSSLLALKLPAVPASLGVRPQVLKLHFAGPGVQGLFLTPQFPCRTLAAAGHSGLASHAVHDIFIGETQSLIYSPVSVRGDFLFDAILQRPICQLHERLDLLPAEHAQPTDLDNLRSGAGLSGGDVAQNCSRNPQLATRNAQLDGISFVPTLCPTCGWDLEGEKETLVLLCRKCGSGWQAGAAGLERVEFGFASGMDRGTPVEYLPFWKLTAWATGLELKSYADLARLANLPRATQKTWEEREPHFWVPAFKTQPHLFLRLSKSLTVLDNEPQIDPEAELPASPVYPVTLPPSEAAAALKLLIASLIPSRKPVLSMMENVSFLVTGSSLIYLPFISRGEELILPEIPMGIQKSAVSRGRAI